MSEVERIKQLAQALASLRIARIAIQDAKKHLDHANIADGVLDKCEETDEWLNKLIPRLTSVLDTMDASD